MNPNAAHTLAGTTTQPLSLQNRSLSVKLAAVLLGTLLLTVSSLITVPMVPVPMTLQTLAVTLVGALYGWRLGSVTIIAWLVEGALGLPVLAGGASGIAHFMGPTGGYLFAFPLAGALTGWLAGRGRNGSRPFLVFLAMLAGNTLCLLLGAVWLAGMIGPAKAITLGVLPFVFGGVLKSILGAAIVRAWSAMR
ncbi:putative biotin transporter BioY [Thiomonas sp. X19]|uniref:biotin transporter BioY n=1 Tax=Thiomonas sp. X19 TaxID=1050370 RepID=UPI000B683BE4|nr:biotin transporter BioY [Thiomonas sp. X19]SCC93790.1 putative biotin transporter BioY [Thiomonas sp. X19]